MCNICNGTDKLSIEDKDTMVWIIDGKLCIETMSNEIQNYVDFKIENCPFCGDKIMPTKV